MSNSGAKRLKQGDALLPLLFNFVLEYIIRRVQENQDGIHQLMVCADDVNVMGRSIPAINKNREALVVASKGIGPEVNVDKIKYMVMPRDQNAGQSHIMRTDNSSLQRWNSSNTW
jgi:hypothetical protein